MHYEYKLVRFLVGGGGSYESLTEEFVTAGESGFRVVETRGDWALMERTYQ